MASEELDDAEDVGTVLREVRYPLPRLLRELRLERTGSLFAKEILDQKEISQIFTTRRKKHAKRAK
ncbi:MAG TPA: hypothetical protein VK178_18985 [Opitutaceae bacterium]|nr:hypothetical protein [Opitutaceae bacterium]